MELEVNLLERVRTYQSLSRWEKSELGRDLRRAGLSYGEIMELIPVKKSTLATWCRDVTLTDEQIEALKTRTGENARKPDTGRKRRAEIAELRAIAREQVPEVIDDPAWVAGLILYWAEGAKTRNHVSIANTDPRALRLFIRWVRTYLNPSARFSLQLHLHEGNDEKAARTYWREETGLNRANFHKTFIKPAGTGHRKNNLKQGICTVKLKRSADAWNIVMEWIDAYTRHFGLTGPEN